MEQTSFLDNPATIQQVDPTPLEVAINRARKQWGIREDFVPLATAGGATVWGKPLTTKGIDNGQG